MTVLTGGERAKWLLVGIAACAWKGLMLFCYLPPSKRYLWKDHFGFTDPDLDPEWRRFLDPRSQWHDATNILVEWVRLNPQRGAKTLCGLLAITLALALLALALALGGG